MKAIHNAPIFGPFGLSAVFKEQRYDKWKQFTTPLWWRFWCWRLFSKSKDTINESNSQRCKVFLIKLFAVLKEQRYDKWKQFTTNCVSHLIIHRLFSKSKDTINESNSQRVNRVVIISIAVFKEQRYDKWKQFTTPVEPVLKACGCFQRAKIR